MKGEIPIFKKCCFWFPLRYGLLMWGYFKLIADALIITFLSVSMMRVSMDIRGPVTDREALTRSIYESMAIPAIALAVFIVDFMATILFIFGGHQKNVKLIRVFYYMSMAMLAFTSLLTILSIVVFVQGFVFLSAQFFLKLLVTFSFYFVCFAVQIYFIFLLRNEINKLKSSGEFRFVNNAGEAEYTKKYDGTKEETEIEEV